MYFSSMRTFSKNLNSSETASGFTAKFQTFYGVICMVFKSVDDWKIVVDLFFTITFIFSLLRIKQPALCDMFCHFHGLYTHTP